MTHDLLLKLDLSQAQQPEMLRNCLRWKPRYAQGLRQSCAIELLMWWTGRVLLLWHLCCIASSWRVPRSLCAHPPRGLALRS